MQSSLQTETAVSERNGSFAMWKLGLLILGLIGLYLFLTDLNAGAGALVIPLAAGFIALVGAGLARE